MMSRLVRLHPGMLSVSEFFTMLSERAFVGDRLTGKEVCERLTRLSPAYAVFVEVGTPVDEVVYRPGPETRYDVPEDFPPILAVTLPFLTDTPERLLDELLAAVGTRGERPLGEHYRFVLDWLRKHFRRRIWVERSGASLRWVPVLARMFPDARFVHICRDGRDVALSMREHPPTRMLLSTFQGMAGVGLDPFAVENAIGVDPLWPGIIEKFVTAAEVRWSVPEAVDIAAMGWLWNGMIEAGLDSLGALSAAWVLTIRFEDLVAGPEDELRRFQRFVGEEFQNPEWVQAAAAIPRRAPSRRKRLPPEERERLTAACAPGLARLGYGL